MTWKVVRRFGLAEALSVRAMLPEGDVAPVPGEAPARIRVAMGDDGTRRPDGDRAAWRLMECASFLGKATGGDLVLRMADALVRVSPHERADSILVVAVPDDATDEPGFLRALAAIAPDDVLDDATLATIEVESGVTDDGLAAVALDVLLCWDEGPGQVRLARAVEFAAEGEGPPERIRGVVWGATPGGPWDGRMGERILRAALAWAGPRTALEHDGTSHRRLRGAWSAPTGEVVAKRPRAGGSAAVAAAGRRAARARTLAWLRDVAGERGLADEAEASWTGHAARGPRRVD